LIERVYKKMVQSGDIIEIYEYEKGYLIIRINKQKITKGVL